jgi:dihydroorotase
MPHDLLLRRGHLVDPGQGRNGLFDIAISNGRIARIEPVIAPHEAAQTIDLDGKLVTPGLIDTHGHVFEYVTGRFGLNADLCGVRSGVTTLIDQGGPSCMTLPAFRHHVVEAHRTRVFAYLSAYLVGGMEGHYYPSLYRPDCLDVAATVRAARDNPDLVKGFKAHAELGGFARWGIEVMRLSAQIAAEAGLPLYIHFGQLWPLPDGGAHGVDPDSILDQVVPLLKAGTSWPIPSRATPAASSTARARSTQSFKRRWRAD